MPRAEDAQALREIALLGAFQGLVEVSTGQLARILGTSQQTASRRILDLERFGYIRRERGIRKQLIRLTEEGVNVLAREFASYKRLFENRDRLEIRGRVASGLGEGRYYLEQPGYIAQFRDKLGFVPYPGTLNVQVEGAEMNKLRILRSSPAVHIEEFRNEERTFGAVDAWRAQIGRLPCALILPRRTHHAQTVEVVAQDFLRGKLELKDGDEIEVRVYL